ncbi:protein PAL OF QUIRKY [Gastrolobium bilobum]|uniref:protein PAL OF QUIRKY n=1 Tax=Gastrolobium bilobum TaxID=150636 RepID=UPI002AB086AA|nr:protein PAL OF QUIRKY [Gastrolobium bilobum]
MTSHSHYPSELDADSVASSPRSEHFHEPLPRVRFMCSFGGKILPRPHDNQLRYVGGDTRIVAVHRSISFSALLLKLSKLSGMTNITAKYQLPNEDLDALISVTTDEDVENMMDEYDRVAHNQNPRSARLRLFLFNEGEDSRASSISSLLNGSANRENWFLDALNGGVSGLERGRSEASSMVSEVPDYLFGLDNSDETHHHPREPRPKDRPVFHDNVSNSDPGSPAPVLSSPFCSTSSVPCVPSIPNLPPVKTKPANPNPDMEFKQNHIEAETGGQPQPNPYQHNPVVHYSPEAAYSGHSVQPVPVYYVSGPVQSGTVPVQPVPIQSPYPYVQQPYHAVVQGQVPIGYHHLVSGPGQVFGAGVRHVTPMHPYESAVHGGLNQQVYQAMPNSGMVPVHPAMAMTGSRDETDRGGAEFVAGRGTNSLNN